MVCLVRVAFASASLSAFLSSATQTACRALWTSDSTVQWLNHRKPSGQRVVARSLDRLDSRPDRGVLYRSPVTSTAAAALGLLKCLSVGPSLRLSMCPSTPAPCLPRMPPSSAPSSALCDASTASTDNENGLSESKQRAVARSLAASLVRPTRLLFIAAAASNACAVEQHLLLLIVQKSCSLAPASLRSFVRSIYHSCSLEKEHSGIIQDGLAAELEGTNVGKSKAREDEEAPPYSCGNGALLNTFNARIRLRPMILNRNHVSLAGLLFPSDTLTCGADRIARGTLVLIFPKSANRFMTLNEHLEGETTLSNECSSTFDFVPKLRL